MGGKREFRFITFCKISYQMVEFFIKTISKCWILEIQNMGFKKRLCFPKLYTNGTNWGYLRNFTVFMNPKINHVWRCLAALSWQKPAEPIELKLDVQSAHFPYSLHIYLTNCYESLYPTTKQLYLFLTDRVGYVIPHLRLE